MKNIYNLQGLAGNFNFDCIEGKWSYFDSRSYGISGICSSIAVDGMVYDIYNNIVSINESKGLSDVHGNYDSITITTTLLQVPLQCETAFKVYSNSSFILSDTILKNIGKGSVSLGKFKLVDRSSRTDGNISAGHVSSMTVLCETGWVINNQVKRLDSEDGMHSSKTVGLLYNPDNMVALNCSYLTFDRANTEIIYEKVQDSGAYIGMVCDFDGYRLMPTASIKSETVYIEICTNPFLSLEKWSEAVCAYYKPVFSAKPSLGWVGGWLWRDGFTQETYEEIILDNITALEKKLGGFGIKYIWASIGNIKDLVPGKWMEENRELFPHGWEWLIKKLDRSGMKLGFWIAPFWIPDRFSDLFDKHKEHLLKKDGEYIRQNYGFMLGKHGQLPRDERMGFYCQDGSHPLTIEFLKEVFSYYKKLGISYFMIDFLYTGSGSTPGEFIYDEYHDTSKIKGPEVYRAALKTIREAAGEETYLLSSTGPTYQNIGYVDAVRIAPDYGEGRPLVKEYQTYPATYIIHDWELIKTVASNMAASYFTDRKFYYNESFNVLTIDKPVPLNEARINVSMFGLSAGPVMLGDDIAIIDEERLALIKKCLPQYERSADPVDLFTSVYPDYPAIFNLKVTKPWDKWNVVGILNLDCQTRQYNIGLESLGLDTGCKYQVFDFWEGMYSGDIEKELIAEVPPFSIKVFRVSKMMNHPWLLSSDMHISQGGVEVESLKWDEKRKLLKAVCTRPVAENGNLYVRVPKGWKPLDYKGIKAAKVKDGGTIIISKSIWFEKETVTLDMYFEES